MTIQLPVSAIDPSDNNGTSHISANFQAGGSYYLSRVNCTLLLDSSPFPSSLLSLEPVGGPAGGGAVCLDVKSLGELASCWCWPCLG